MMLLEAYTVYPSDDAIEPNKEQMKRRLIYGNFIIRNI